MSKTKESLDVQVARAIGREVRWAEGEIDLVDGWLDVELHSAVRAYSTDANAALAAYEVMRERGWRITQCFQNIDSSFEVELHRLNRAAIFGADDCDDECGDGPTFAEAICRAIVAAGRIG